MRLLALAALVAAGCYSPPSVGTCSVACTEEGACPEGSSCGNDGYCHEPGDTTVCTPSGAELAAIAAGGGFTCAIDPDDHLWCWGGNSFEEIGSDQLEVQIPEPRMIATATISTWSAVATGRNHACAIGSDQELYCWGFDQYGQLGDGAPDAENEHVPTAVAVAGPWDAVAAGESHTCALRAGELWCWGVNYARQLGEGTAESTSHAPVRVGTATDWTTVDAGVTHTCGTRGDTLYCWGEAVVLGVDPPLADDDPAPHAIEHPIAGRRWVTHAAGGEAHCAIDDQAALYCWGTNLHAGLGRGPDVGNAPIPTLADDTRTWTAIDGNSTHACGLAGEELYCWGESPTGETGVRGARLPMNAIDGAWSKVSVGGGHTCAISAAGQGYCWGDNGAGQLGGGTAGDAYEPVLVDDTHDWAEVAAGASITCAVTSGDGLLHCWGLDDHELLGGGGDVAAAGPIAIGALAELAWEQVALDGDHACAIATGGALWCWGRGAEGQLGGGVVASPAPVQVPGTWSDVGVGSLYTCAIDDAGDLFCWGYNQEARVGDPSRIDEIIATPFEIGAGGWSRVGVGERHACAVRVDGGAQCWGYNRANAVDELDVDGSIAPPRDVTGTGWARIDAATDYSPHSCAVAADGSAACWGNDESGRLGNGTTLIDPQPSPSAVELDLWEDIQVGGPMGCGLRDGGHLYCWGAGTAGVGADGSALGSGSPDPVDGRGGWIDVAVGFGHICAIDADAALWCWGDGSRLQLGVGLGMSTTPVAIELPGGGA